MEFPENTKTFLNEPNFMIIGTLRKNNTIQMTVVWFAYNNGIFKVSTSSKTIKYKNIMNNPNVTFVILDRNNPLKFMQVSGTATITRKGAHEFIDSLSSHYVGVTPYQGDPEHKEDRVIITIQPEKYMTSGL